MDAIEVDQLTKRFGTFTAVDAVSFVVEHEEIFGLLGPSWTTRTEYLYVDLGSVSDPYTFNGTGNVFNSTIREHIWRSGLNYKFGGDAVVAKN